MRNAPRNRISGSVSAFHARTLPEADHIADLLIRFLGQNNGVLSKRARQKEFRALSGAECAQLEALYAEIFGEST